VRGVELYDYFRSSAAYRVRIALNLKGVVPDERTFVHLRMGNQRAQDYLALNPQGLVPALALDHGLVLTQSLAIIEYLDETHPDPPLLPVAPPSRARVRAIALAIACEIHPLNNLRVLNYLIGTLGVAREQKDAQERETGVFCHGNEPTLADVCLVPQIANARRFGIDLSPYPTLTRIEAACLALPAFAAAAPERQPDAE